MAEDVAEQYQAKWNEYQLGQLASLAQQRVFQIPRFQRDFVWNEGQIKLLADSVARNYPIGSLLLLAENRSALQLAGRPIDAIVEEEETGVDPTTADEPLATPMRFHVLDGQQRLTSLVRVFANVSPKRVYYVDLVKVLESFGPDRTEETDWLVSRARPKDPKLAKDRGKLVRSDVLLDVKKSSLYLDEFIDEVQQEELPAAFRAADDKTRRAKRREAKATLAQVFETIRNYRVPAIVIDRESPLSAIGRIFETINSTGRRLTTFDLAVASFYPEPDLRTLWEETLRKYPRIQRYEIDGERVLQLLVLHDNREATRNAILGLTTKREYVLREWDNVAAAIDRALKWAEDHGARPPALPQEPTVIGIASLFYSKDAEHWLKRTAGAFAQLERWYFSKILQPGAKAASNYNIGKDHKALLEWSQGGASLPITPVRLSPNTLASIQPSDVRYKAIFSLLVREVKQDIKTQASLTSDVPVEDHHLFPRSFRKRHNLDKKHLDGIANRLPVTKETNQQFSDRPPQEYFKEILRVPARGPVTETIRRAGLGEVQSNESFLERMSEERFEAFIQERARQLLEMIARVLNGALQSDEDTDLDTD
jgi:hypothetical protein